MKISSVNNFNYNQKQQSFNGLWGKTISHNPDYDPVLATTVQKEIAYYYPFLDETQMEINKVIEENSSSRVIKGRQVLDRECVECEPLSTTREKYNQYMKLQNLEDFTDTHRATHVVVREKFTDTGFNPDDSILEIEQTPAVNQTIQDALAQKTVGHTQGINTII